MQNSLDAYGFIDFSRFLVIIIPLVVIQFALLIAALVSLAKKRYVQGNDKILWALIIIFVGFIGSILYFAVGSSHLDQKAAETEDRLNDQHEYKTRGSDQWFN